MIAFDYDTRNHNDDDTRQVLLVLIFILLFFIFLFPCSNPDGEANSELSKLSSTNKSNRSEKILWPVYEQQRQQYLAILSECVYQLYLTLSSVLLFFFPTLFILFPWSLLNFFCTHINIVDTFITFYLVMRSLFYPFLLFFYRFTIEHDALRLFAPFNLQQFVSIVSFN